MRPAAVARPSAHPSKPPQAPETARSVALQTRRAPHNQAISSTTSRRRTYVRIDPSDGDPTLRTRVLFIGNIDARAAHPWCACLDPRVPSTRGRRSSRLGGRPRGSRDHRRAPLGSCAPHAVARASSSTSARPAAPAATGVRLPDRVRAPRRARGARSLRRAGLSGASAWLEDHDGQLAGRDRLVVVVAAVDLDELGP